MWVWTVIGVGQVTLKNGRVEQSNFTDFRIMRLNESPAIDVHLIQNSEAPVLMRLDTRALAIAAGTTAGVLFTLCALAVAIAPGPTTAFFGYLVHLDLSGLPRTLSVGRFIGGLICWTLGTALSFGFAATVNNRFVGVGFRAEAAGHHPTAVRA
jgi:hypothetical protein